MVVSWNIDGWHTIRAEQLDLLDSTGAQIALLQEVTPASMELLRRAGWSGTSALELVDAGHVERGGALPRFACAVLVRGQAGSISVRLVPEAPSAVRAVSAKLRMAGHEILAISAALPPGSMWGRPAKVGQADALTQELRDWKGPAMIGMDRNGPKFERWEDARTEWWREDPREFFAADAPHGCSDVLELWYRANPRAAARVQQASPDGPKQISYVEHRADPPIPRRYDVILINDVFEVLDVRYRYAEAVEAGSDHGLVETHLRVT